MSALKYDLPFVDYLVKDAEHFSTLKAMDTSPLHYKHARDTERHDTAALRVGRAVHAAILGSGGEVTVYPGPVRRGKEWEAFKAANLTRTILTADEHEACGRMADAVATNRHARALLVDGHPEVSALWTHRHEDGGSALVKCRFDYLTAPGFVELKTTRAIGEREFARQVATLAYHAQLGLYDRAYMATHDGKHATVALIAVENIEPYDVAVYEVGDEVIEAGWSLARRWLDRVIECRAVGRWPGAVPSPIALQLPEWAVPTFELTINGESL